MNPVLKAIRERRSIRKFTDEPVDEDKVTAILEAGRWAPSGLNNQPWRFVVITDPALRAAVAEKTEYHRILESAPLLVAVFLDLEQSYSRTRISRRSGPAFRTCSWPYTAWAWARFGWGRS